MNSLVKIRDLSHRYGISARALRYYEDMGLITSIRSLDYAYRLYDDAAVQRLEQILILRKLGISIKDIQRIFSTEGSDILLDVLQNKADSLSEEAALLQELRMIVLDFIEQIRCIDFREDSGIKLLYSKTAEIESRIKTVPQAETAAPLNRLAEVSDKLDSKIPDIFVLRIPAFRAVTSGRMSMETLFGGEFIPWQEQNREIFTPVLFDACDFLCGTGDAFEWFWAISPNVTEAETHPYPIVTHPGGLYAAAVSIDGDGLSHNKVREKIQKWLEGTDFAYDDSRDFMGHMIYTDEEIKSALGYHQMVLYTPIRKKRN